MSFYIESLRDLLTKSFSLVIYRNSKSKSEKVVMVGDYDQGLGKVVLVGAGLESSGVINFVPLLLGRTVKGCIYGGVRIHSDLPLIINRCINKVYLSLYIYK